MMTIPERQLIIDEIRDSARTEGEFAALLRGRNPAELSAASQVWPGRSRSWPEWPGSPASQLDALQLLDPATDLNDLGTARLATRTLGELVTIARSAPVVAAPLERDWGRLAHSVRAETVHDLDPLGRLACDICPGLYWNYPTTRSMSRLHAGLLRIYGEIILFGLQQIARTGMSDSWLYLEPAWVRLQRCYTDFEKTWLSGATMTDRVIDWVWRDQAADDWWMNAVTRPDGLYHIGFACGIHPTIAMIELARELIAKRQCS